MNAFLQPSFYKDSVRVLAFAFSLACFSHAEAQPYIVSTVPEYAATGVSPAASAVYTFSEAMTPGATAVQFYKASPLTFLAVSNFCAPPLTIGLVLLTACSRTALARSPD